VPVGSVQGGSKYEWDPDKNATNILKHGVSFLEAESVLDSELSRVMVDAEHSDLEVRFLTIGWSNLGRLLLVVTSEDGPRPRIISARRATKRERDEYTRRR
jgi:uncharacterized DUF497 family protein